MRENKPVLLVLSAYDEEIILENGEILCEKRHWEQLVEVSPMFARYPKLTRREIPMVLLQPVE